jgi:hypothetical protein
VDDDACADQDYIFERDEKAQAWEREKALAKKEGRRPKKPKKAKKPSEIPIAWRAEKQFMELDGEWGSVEPTDMDAPLRRGTRLRKKRSFFQTDMPPLNPKKRARQLR